MGREVEWQPTTPEESERSVLGGRRETRRSSAPEAGVGRDQQMLPRKVGMRSWSRGVAAKRPFGDW